MSTSSTSQNHFFRREVRALAVISLLLIICATLFTFGLISAGYTLVEATEWFVRISSS